MRSEKGNEFLSKHFVVGHLQWKSSEEYLIPLFSQAGISPSRVNDVKQRNWTFFFGGQKQSGLDWVIKSKRRGTISRRFLRHDQSF